MALLMLPLETREHAEPCPSCLGRGVTGDQVKMPVGSGNTLLMELICAQCGGCGNGDIAHAGCQPNWHAYPEDYTEGDIEIVPLDEQACYSCGTGRGWYPVQGFTGEGENTEMHVVRQLCGCSESRLAEVSGGPDAAGQDAGRASGTGMAP